MNSLRKWFRKYPTGRRSSAGRPRRPERVRPALEGLEERTVPTIMFIPQLGLETQAQNNGGSLSSYAVEIVYWGPDWYWTQDKMN
jgi:hypothetical protein